MSKKAFPRLRRPRAPRLRPCAAVRQREWLKTLPEVRKGPLPPKDWTPKHACPCCDYITLAERGIGLICPVCWWQDEGLARDILNLPSPVNRELTLSAARENFQRCGVCDTSLAAFALSAAEREKFVRRQAEQTDVAAQI